MDYPCDTCEKQKECNGQDALFCCLLCKWERERKGVMPNVWRYSTELAGRMDNFTDVAPPQPVQIQVVCILEHHAGDGKGVFHRLL